jgi:hypothetical protein
MHWPVEDPPGWTVLQPVELKASIFSTREAMVRCSVSAHASSSPNSFPHQFAVGSPVRLQQIPPSPLTLYQLVYATNSPIPLWVTLTSPDDQALDLIVSTKSIQARLRRSLAVGPDADADDRPIRTDTTFEETTATASIWPVTNPTYSHEGLGKIELEGEIFIPGGTKTSFIFSEVCVRVSFDYNPLYNSMFTQTICSVVFC